MFGGVGGIFESDAGMFGQIMGKSWAYSLVLWKCLGMSWACLPVS